MNSKRIQELQNKTAYPESVSVKQALLQVWNECEQEQLRLCGVGRTEGELPHWTDNDVDASYLMGCMNVGGIDSIAKELERLKELGLTPHEAVRKVRGKR